MHILDTPIDFLKGVGPARADLLKKELYIFTYGDLLMHYPFRYIDKIRYTLLISYPITKNIGFDLAYRIQQEFYVNNPKTLFIFGGKLSYKL